MFGYVFLVSMFPFWISGGLTVCPGTCMPVLPCSLIPLPAMKKPFSVVFFISPTGAFSSINGGCDNLAGSTGAPQPSGCFSGGQAVAGGDQNQATGVDSSIAGGRSNLPGAGTPPRSAGCFREQAIAGGLLNTPTGGLSSV